MMTLAFFLEYLACANEVCSLQHTTHRIDHIYSYHSIRILYREPKVLAPPNCHYRTAPLPRLVHGVKVMVRMAGMNAFGGLRHFFRRNLIETVCRQSHFIIAHQRNGHLVLWT